MHADGPRAVGPHGKPVEASAGTTASDVGDIWKSDSKNLKVVLGSSFMDVEVPLAMPVGRR